MNTQENSIQFSTPLVVWILPRSLPWHITHKLWHSTAFDTKQAVEFSTYCNYYVKGARKRHWANGFNVKCFTRVILSWTFYPIAAMADLVTGFDYHWTPTQVDRKWQDEVSSSSNSYPSIISNRLISGCSDGKNTVLPILPYSKTPHVLRGLCSGVC